MSSIETQVIIPLHNGEKFIGDLLDSLSVQDTDKFTVFVTNNRSSDNSVRVVEGFKDKLNLNIIDASEKASKAFALNKAIAATSMKKILFIDQDDTVNSSYISSMSAALENNSLVAAFMDAEKLNKSDEVRSRDTPFNQKIGSFPVRIASGGSIGVTRKAIDNIGYFDENFNYSTNDVEFCCRAHYKGYDLQLAEGAILNYRLREGWAANLKQGVYYGNGNFQIARIYPEVRGDQKNTFALLRNIGESVLSLIDNENTVDRDFHSIGKDIGQIAAKLSSRF